MAKLNQDGTVDLNAMAEEVAAMEKGAEEVNIAQIKEIMPKVAKFLLKVNEEHNIMVETIKRLAE